MGIIKIREASKNAVIGRQNPQRRKSTRGNVLKVDSFFKSSDGRQSVPGNRKRVSASFCGRGDHENPGPSRHLESELPVLWLKFLMFRLCLQKKTQTKNIAGDVYTNKSRIFHPWKSFYDIIVSKEFLGKGDKVLLIDDFWQTEKRWKDWQPWYRIPVQSS